MLFKNRSNAECAPGHHDTIAVRRRDPTYPSIMIATAARRRTPRAIHRAVQRALSSSSSTTTSTATGAAEAAAARAVTPALADAFYSNGFVVLPQVFNFAADGLGARLKKRLERMFSGDFETGVYPDEWHWRAGLSLPDAPREICNGWKSDRLVASVVLSEVLGAVATRLMARHGWTGARVAQDDVLWKPAGAGEVAYHQDSAYISRQFVPRENNSVTLWVALDDADAANGAVEYAPGSHAWQQPQEGRSNEQQQEEELEATTSAFHGHDGNFRAHAVAAATAAGAPAPAWESPDVPSGAVLVHHQDAWHGSGPNTTADRPRRSLVVHLLRDDVRFADAHASDYLRHPGAAGAANYIYARYKRLGDDALDEAFFPTTYREGGGRADFLEGYCSTVPPLCGD